MKRRVMIIFSAILCMAGLAQGVDFVDIGDTNSELGYTMTSWGPVEPATSGGAYGGVANCRTIWSSFDNSTNATIVMNFPGGNVQVAFRHLEGIADDGFEVYIDGVWCFTHTEMQTTELWFVSGFNCNIAAGPHTIEFVATGQPWTSWSTYGQVCIDWIEVDGGAVPQEEATWGGVKTLYR